MTTYYAICNVNGPVSIRLDAESLEAAIQEFEDTDSRAWIDDPRMDAEEDLGINGEGMSEDEFESALRVAGARPVRDLDQIVNAHAGTVAHLSGGWYLWAME